MGTQVYFWKKINALLFIACFTFILKHLQHRRIWLIPLNMNNIFFTSTLSFILRLDESFLIGKFFYCLDFKLCTKTYFKRKKKVPLVQHPIETILALLLLMSVL